MFIRFDMIHECDRQTDGRTPHGGNSRAYALHRVANTSVLTSLTHVRVAVDHTHTHCPSNCKKAAKLNISH